MPIQHHPLTVLVLSLLLISFLGGCGSQDGPAKAPPGAARPNEGESPPPQAEMPLAPSALARMEFEFPDTLQEMTVSVPLDGLRAPSSPVERDRYARIEANPVKAVAEQPVSTFSIDVDTGAYAVVRRHLDAGRLPPQDAVRVEELINYFDYDYPPPKDRAPPFSITTEVGRTPWNPDTWLVAIGIKGFETPRAQRPPANLVFLIDVSGSMDEPDKLPLLKSAFRLLVEQLGERDRVSLVVYAGASGVVLEPTPGNQKGTILAALEQLSAGGSTHGAAGIHLAYAMAEQARLKDGINRVILATDGDFNVGIVDHAQLMDLIGQQRAKGIALTTLGFGQGNYNDALMEQLADKGNGHYAYIDGLQEARKVLVEELSATLETIAADVKIQLEWNPGLVAEYRLIGYENRQLAREDFRNDKVDAGDIGAGHRVTALYEIALVGGPGQQLEPLRYGAPQPAAEGKTDELGWLRLRYKTPGASGSQLLERPIPRQGMRADLAQTSADLRFSAAVAAFGQLLRGGQHTGAFSYEDAAKLAEGARGTDPFGYRAEFPRLARLAGSLDQRAGQDSPETPEPDQRP